LANAGIEKATLERLADADAFRSMDLDRRDALWEIAALGDRPIQLFENQQSESSNEQIKLPLMTLGEHVVHDLATTKLSIKAHPVSFVRTELNALHALPTNRLKDLKNGDEVRIAGLITVRQRPGTAKGVLFITIKDETSFANIVVWESVFEKYRRDILAAKLLMVEGHVQIEGQVIHVVAKHCYDASELLRKLTPQQNAELQIEFARADETSDVVPAYEVIHKGRNFH
jgi:error-prone DNA polymerase